MVDMVDGIAELAAALTKAQAAFPPIPRDKTVTVTMKTGGSYTFSYAPLDTILSAVRGPLSDNGLAITQLLDDGELVTMLLHEKGGRLSGRMALPLSEGNIQALGSAITYIRRYAIQAVLGIATEEDDDGNGAAGNKVKAGKKGTPPVSHFGPPDRAPLERRTNPENGLVGKVATSGTQDFQLRESPEGWTLPFRLKDSPNKAGQIVIAHDAIAQALAPFKDTLIGQNVTVWGRYTDEETSPNAKGEVFGFTVLHIERIATPDFIIPAPSSDTPLEAQGEPIWPDEAEQAAILAAEMAEATA